MVNEKNDNNTWVSVRERMPPSIRRPEYPCEGSGLDGLSGIVLRRPGGGEIFDPPEIGRLKSGREEKRNAKVEGWRQNQALGW